MQSRSFHFGTGQGILARMVTSAYTALRMSPPTKLKELVSILSLYLSFPPLPSSQQIHATIFSPRGSPGECVAAATHGSVRQGGLVVGSLVGLVIVVRLEPVVLYFGYGAAGAHV